MGFRQSGRLTKEKHFEMSDKDGTQELYRRMEERRKLRAKRPIAEKLAIAEELRDLQQALAPVREANRKRVASTQSKGSHQG